MKLFPLFLTFLVLAPTAWALDVPKGYTLQVLDPTGGQISRPNDWHYIERHHDPMLQWTISREDLHKGPYEVGLTIQALMGVSRNTGKTPKNYCLAYLAAEGQGSKLITTFPETTQGPFTCQGIEIEKELTVKGAGTKTYHFVYTAFWGTNSDIAVITMASAPADLWPKYQKTFEVMKAFQILDPNRVQVITNQPVSNNTAAPDATGK